MTKRAKVHTFVPDWLRRCGEWTDVRIARAYGVHVYTVRNWRNRYRIPSARPPVVKLEGVEYRDWHVWLGCASGAAIARGYGITRQNVHRARKTLGFMAKP